MLFNNKKFYLFFNIVFLFITSCGYGFSSLRNKWEIKGIETIEVPLFDNETIEGGAEVFFTNALRLNLVSRSGKLKFVRSNADAVIEGKVNAITINPEGILFGNEGTQAIGGLPDGRMLASSYVVTATVDLKMIRLRDKQVMWKSRFSQARSMQSGTFTDERRSSNSFIKESSKKEAIRELSDMMMQQAVDSLLEDF